MDSLLVTYSSLHGPVRANSSESKDLHAITTPQTLRVGRHFPQGYFSLEGAAGDACVNQ